MQENMENFIKQGGDALLPPLVVPVDWACADEIAYHARPGKRGARRTRPWELPPRREAVGHHQVVAHSMGNRVLRCVGKSAVSDDSSWYTDALQDGVSLLEAAPKDLKIPRAVLTWRTLSLRQQLTRKT